MATTSNDIVSMFSSMVAANDAVGTGATGNQITHSVADPNGINPCTTSPGATTRTRR